MHRTMESFQSTFVLGSVGVITPLISVAISLTSVVAWLQIASLSVGIVVGVLTIVALIRKNKK